MKPIDIIAGIIIAIAVMWLALANGANFADHPVSTALIGLLIFGYFFGVWMSRNMKEPAPPEKALPPLSDNYGAADFAPQQGIGANSLSNGIFFGKSSSPTLKNSSLSQNPGGPVCSEPARHTLIVASTRSGKGTRLVIPTLLRNLSSSCIVIDPKGELAAATARARSRRQHIQIINPWGELKSTFETLGFSSATYNPLDMLDPNDPNAVSHAQAFVTTICPPTAGKEDFWVGSAGDLLTAVLLYLAYQPGEEKTLARARQITSLDRRSLSEIIAKMCAIEAYNGGIRQFAQQYLDMAQETYSGITSSLNRKLAFTTDTQFQRATTRSTFSMRDLTGFGKDRPTTLYIVAPTRNLKTQMVWLRMLIQSAIAAFTEHPGERQYRCLFILDEFTNLGMIEDMPNDITFAAGHGIDFMLIIQGFKQLKATYHDHDGAIIGNCAFKYFCNIDDLDTAKYLSEALGKRTVRTIGKGENINTSPTGAGVDREGETTTYGEMGKLLLAPDEVMQLGPDTAILFAPKSAPHYLRPVDYWRLPEAFSMYPGLLSDPPFEYERNPLEKKSTARSALEPLAPPPQDHTPASQPSPSGWRKLRRWLNSEPNRKPKATKSPAPAQPQETRSGSPNYDPEYYSPWKIAEREAAAAKERQQSPPPAPSTDKRPPIDHMLYSDLNPNRIPWMKPPWEEPEEKPPAPPPSEKPAVEVQPDPQPDPPSPKKPKLRDGEYDVDSDKFEPYRKEPKGGDG